jgi:hypothetical protein
VNPKQRETRKQKAARLSRESYQRHRDEILYARRVRYWKDKRFRRRCQEANRKSMARPGAKLAFSERQSRRKEKARAFRRHKKELLRLSQRSLVSLKDLEFPTYVIQRAGPLEREEWPLDDDAAIWLALHDPEQLGFDPTTDTTKQKVSCLPLTPSGERAQGV